MTSYDNPASGTSYHGRPATGTQTPGLAVAALVTGIGGLIFFWLIPILGLALGVLGVVFGVMTTRRAKAGAPPPRHTPASPAVLPCPRKPHPSHPPPPPPRVTGRH
ncbi:phage holin family protein [Streptomyces sp. NEAU-H3]|uniref:phage holin family protein n=1 Tax=Streptomyces sp. NEAU-H3 TaxID=2720636 RepID=UPI00143C940D|nr:phage holin family protein [Streptomyces sp. NEAU-H3]NJA56546.1 DUF4190 domain-containing protein [Streptomyces sp. NEAU-H3]